VPIDVVYELISSCVLIDQNLAMSVMRREHGHAFYHAPCQRKKRSQGHDTKDYADPQERM